MEGKHRKVLRINIYLCLIILFVFTCSASLVYATETSTTEQTTEVYYEGEAFKTVNVRVDAGTDYAKLLYNDEPIKLALGTKVIIMSTKMVGDKAWYEIMFTWEGTEQKGYVTSSYVSKSDVTVTLTPTPSPEPTATPSPEPTPTSTVTPTPLPVTPTSMPSMGKSGDFTSVWAIIIAVAAVGIIAIIVIYVKNKVTFDGNKNSEILQKMKKIKNINLSEGKEDKNIGQEQITRRKRPEIRVLKEEEVYNDEETGFDNSMFESEFDEEIPTSESIKASASKESEEKKALRAEINKLKQHDIVIHKYFGKGEVYDNSDVKLLEVRFATDVRFLNKDSLVAKRLLKKYEDDKRLPRKKL